MSLRAAVMVALAVLYLACLMLAPGGSLATLEPHAALLSPRLAHPLGTDDLGRDMLAALLQGGRTSLTVATIATVLALAVGLLAGLLAGLGPALLDEALMRVAEITAACPRCSWRCWWRRCSAGPPGTSPCYSA
jgi:peptide/nickel transport system permease protein